MAKPGSKKSETKTLPVRCRQCKVGSHRPCVDLDDRPLPEVHEIRAKDWEASPERIEAADRATFVDLPESASAVERSEDLLEMRDAIDRLIADGYRRLRLDAGYNSINFTVSRSEDPRSKA